VWRSLERGRAFFLAASNASGPRAVRTPPAIPVDRWGRSGQMLREGPSAQATSTGGKLDFMQHEKALPDLVSKLRKQWPRRHEPGFLMTFTSSSITLARTFIHVLKRPLRGGIALNALRLDDLGFAALHVDEHIVQKCLQVFPSSRGPAAIAVAKPCAHRSRFGGSHRDGRQYP